MCMVAKKILLVEDDTSLRNAIQIFLSRSGNAHVTAVADARAAKIELKSEAYDVVLSDIKMPGGSGMELLEKIQTLSPKPVFILMTGYGTIEQSVKAIKLGAYDFLEKPFELDKLKSVIDAALQDSSSYQPRSDSEFTGPVVFENAGKILITQNSHMLDLVNNLKKISNSKATVLIQGESGTGKEVLASMVHYYSPRRDHPFVAINCAALPDNLLESELFGHEKGSFTGAFQRQIGKFETANEGTILLDEISEMSMNMQTKLLRVLQEREIYRIGASKAIPLNIRVIASTNRDLYQYMMAGNFREDLFYRINVVPVNVPPLRERGQDVIELSSYFLDEFAKTHERPRLHLDEQTKQIILGHSWQGNVRELRNAMERASLIGNFEQLGLDIRSPAFVPPIHQSAGHVSTVFQPPGDVFQSNVHACLADIEKEFIVETLKRCQGNRTKAAKHLGISLRTLRNKLKSFKMDDDAQPDA